MEADLVALRRPVSAALAGPDVDEHGTLELERLAERALERLQVVTGHDADVGDAEVLEQLTGLREVHDRLAESPRQLEGRLTDDRHASDQVVIGRLARSPGRREFDRREVFRQRADRRADRHLVVVEHDQHLRLALADVVQRLEAEAAHQGGIADDHCDALVAAGQVAGRRKPLRDGEARAGVSAVEDVVLGLAPPRKAADAVQLPETPEPLVPARQQLVRVGLMPGVPDDAVARRVQQAVQRDRQFDDAQRRAEVAAGAGHRFDDRLADLGRQFRQLAVVEVP